MLNLNLTDINKSDISYTITQFKDGQQTIVLPPSFNSTASFRIKSRIRNFMDLELIICATKALRYYGITDISLYVPYFLGSRSDRKFEEGGINYLKDVIAPIINLQNYTNVSVYHPHSDVLEACINNFKKVTNYSLMEFVIHDYFININHSNISDYNNVLILSPDSGALKNIYSITEHFDIPNEVKVCTKHRNIKGELSNTNVPITHTDLNKDIFIIDDICDGGRTFINIAKEIQAERNRYTYTTRYETTGKLYLIISHFIGSNGLKELSEYFDMIYCTNSYSDINSMTEYGMHNEKYLHKIKQLSII